jgi:peptide/nickel transport system permease protein
MKSASVKRIARLLGRRLAWLLVTVWGVATIVFFLSRLAGNPVALLTPQNATKQQVAQITHDLGLDKPIFYQYWVFLKESVQGNFGQSFYYDQSAIHLVLDRLPATAVLAGTSVGIAVLVAVPLALWAAFHPRGVADRLGGVLATFGQAVPVFWFGPILILLLAVDVHLFPASGQDGPRSLVLPAVSLAFFQIGILFRLGRATALEVLSSEYVRLARAKGASRFRLAISHVVPNVAPVLLTMIGLILASLVGGTVIVESIFNWPGIGNLLVTAASEHDYPVTQALVLVFSISFVVINTTVEILHEIIDPRIRRL